MSAGVYNWTIEQGAAFNRTITWKADNVLVNLTGYTARLTAKTHYADSSLVLDMTTENSEIILGGSAGTISLSLSSAQTAALAFNSAAYNLELIDGSGHVTRLLTGTVTLSKQV